MYYLRIWKIDQNNFWLQFVCCVSTSHMGYIFQIRTWKLGSGKLLKDSEVCYC